ncbi:hypothetical protein ACHAWO_003217 [Cyclotella atomus]|uniref:Kinetochore protein Nuf2 N-terminal domain-containing protein n=1 Tax=Cyclotella atomus TaxID=382360 RepID=A0ABD3P9G9_9STRA
MSSNAIVFPLLKNAMILQIMAELEIPLTEAELTEPGRCRERIREVFRQLLCTCWGLDQETQLDTLSTRIQSQLTTPDTSISAHPQLYKDAFVETKFFCQLQKLFRICGYDEFGLRDLAAPTGRRLRKQLSALINYMKYREDMKHLLDTVLDERAAMFEALEEMAQQHTDLEGRLSEVREIHEAKILEREEAEAECQEMEAEIAQQNKIQSSIRQQNHLLQKTASELKDQVANLSIALRELQAEERQLNKEVVHSPDRVKADVHQAEKELEEVKRLIAKKEEERNLLAKMLKNAVKGEESVKSSTETIEDMDDLVQQYEIAAEDADDLSANADKVERSLEKKTTEKEELDIDIRAIEERHLHTKSKLNKQLDDAKHELNSTVNKLGTVEEERLEGIARVEACQKRIDIIEKLMEAEERQTNETRCKRIEAFHEFEKAFIAKQQSWNGLLSQ